MSKNLVQGIVKKLTQAGSRAATSRRNRRVRFEQLERRLPLAASVVVSGGVLIARGDALAQDLTIEDSHIPGDMDAIVSFDANGDGDFASHPNDMEEVNVGPIHKFDVRLRGGDDVFNLLPRENYEGASKKVYADLGRGVNGFSFDADGNSILSSKISLEVRGGPSEDEVEFNPGPIGALPGGHPSKIRVDYSTGRGPDVADMVLIDPIDDGSEVRYRLSLGGGDDEFIATLNVDSYDILGDSSVAISVDGGRGDDAISVTSSTLISSELMMQSNLSVALWGGGGDDEITVDLGDVIFDDARATIFIDGGRGSDTLSVSITAAATSTNGKLAVVMLGGRGDDFLSIDANDDSGLLRSFLLLHGGRGTDECSNDGSLMAYIFACEL